MAQPEVCRKCGTTAAYSERYDAFYCPHCDEWLEYTCGDEGCEFCHHRPARSTKEPNHAD